MSNKNLFDHCDLFVTTDHGWSFVMGTPKGRAAVDLMFDPLDWDLCSAPLQSIFPTAPLDWKAADLSVTRYERAGKAKLLPRIEGHHKTLDRNTLRIATGAQQTAPDLRIIVYDARHPTGNGYAYFNTTDEDGTVTGGNVLERIIATGKPEAVRFNYDDGGPSETYPNVTTDHGKHFISAFPPSALPKLNGTDWLKEFQPKPKLEVEPEPSTFPTGLPLFELSPSVCGTLSAEDRAAMIADMVEADVLHLPFPKIAVRFWMPDIMPGAQAKFMTFHVSGALAR
jgi:hypothetical protein